MHQVLGFKVFQVFLYLSDIVDYNHSARCNAYPGCISYECSNLLLYLFYPKTSSRTNYMFSVLC